MLSVRPLSHCNVTPRFAAKPQFIAKFTWLIALSRFLSALSPGNILSYLSLFHFVCWLILRVICICWTMVA